MILCVLYSQRIPPPPTGPAPQPPRFGDMGKRLILVKLFTGLSIDERQHISAFDDYQPGNILGKIFNFKITQDVP